jgi:hypothetical protein
MKGDIDHVLAAAIATICLLWLTYGCEAFIWSVAIKGVDGP